MNKLLVAFAAGISVAVGAFGETLETLTLNNTSYVATEDSTIGVLTVTDGTTQNAISVPVGMTVTVNDVQGGGALAKTGGGRLVVRDVAATANLSVTEGKVFFDKSAGVTNLTTAAAVHLDASAADTITVASTSATETKITKWTDVRGEANYPWAIYPTSWDSDCYPRYQSAAQNGLNYVDLRTTGNSWSTGSFFQMGNFQGTDAEGADSGYGNAQIGIKGVKEIFLVVKDQPGTGGYQSFLGDVNSNWNYFFGRGANGEIWNASVSETAALRNGTTWVDGTAVSGTSLFPEGFHLLRARATSASQRFRTLGHYCSGSKNGGLAYGEVIVFKSDVADTTAAALTRCLTHKWFGRQTMASLTVAPGAAVDVASGETIHVSRADGGKLEYSSAGVALVIGAGETCTVADDLTVPCIRAEGDGATLNVSASKTVTAETLTGTRLVKAGAGTLKLSDVEAGAKVHASAGLVNFAKSTGVESLAGAAALHLDASKAESLTLNGSTVTQWSDVRGTTGYPWMKYPGWGAAPSIGADVLNGLATIDFKAASGSPYQGAFLFGGNYQGDDATGSGYYNAPGFKGVREVFMILADHVGTKDDNPLYQNFLGDQNNDYHNFFARGANGEILKFSNETAALCNGNLWVDGQSVAYNSVFPSGYHLFRARTNGGNCRFSTLGYDRQKTNGGIKYGEIVVFKSAVDDAAAARITVRLTHKWFGRQYADDLEIGAGGRVQVAAGETLVVDSLTLAHLDATVGSQPFSPTTATLASTGDVRLTVPAGTHLKSNQEITLLEAQNDIVGAANAANWTVSCDSRRTLRLKVDGKRLYAQVEPVGLFLVVK